MEIKSEKSDEDNGTRSATVNIDERNQEEVKCFKYLGITIVSDRYCTKEASAIIANAKEAFTQKPY